MKTVLEPTITGEMTGAYHYPVMYGEVAKCLDVGQKGVVVDCTLGMGSHARRLLSEMKPDARFIGIDKDEESLALSRLALSAYGERVRLVKADFCDIDEAVASTGAGKVDEVL